MAEITLVIGATARCSDGFLGEVKALVIDPSVRAVTYLVVEPGARSGLARLVPLDHVDVSGEDVRLRYTEAEFKDLDPAEETLAEFVSGYGAPVQLLPAGEGWRSAGGPVADGGAIPQIREMETVALIPETEAGTDAVEEARGDQVYATDGSVGQVGALRVDAGDGRVTQVLLDEGWVIPVGHVSGFDGGIRLDISSEQVWDLPPSG